VLDTLTWTKGKHTLKFGGDYRRLTGFYANVFSSSRLGQYTYNGSVTGSNGGGFVGNPYASFLLGIPDKTQLATVIQPDGDVWANHYAVFAQDDWKVTPRLTLNYGLRWEYHPMFNDHNLNGTNFLPDYMSTVNGVTVRGAAVISNQDAFKIENPLFAAAIAPTPVITAAQAGIPESLRYSSKTDFAPRVGLTWRPFADGKTVIRGGYGRFIEASLGSLYSASWGIHTSYVSIFTNTLPNNQAALSFPYPFPSNLAVPGVYDSSKASICISKIPGFTSGT
jgi:outer membrane receptor protein involved in Fe transport